MSLIDREEALDLIFNWKAKEPWDEFNQQVAFEIIHAMPSALPCPEGFDPEHLTEQDKKDILEALDWVKGTITEEVPSAQPDLQPTCNQLAKDANVPCKDTISRQNAIDMIMGQPPETHYPSWYAEQIKVLPSAQSDRDIPRKPIEGCSLSGRKKVKEATCRNELIKALNYDRNQYAEGYKHGYSYAKSELIRCKDCKYSSYEPCEGFENVYVCDRSVFTRCVGGNMPYDFCSYAERRTDD